MTATYRFLLICAAFLALPFGAPAHRNPLRPSKRHSPFSALFFAAASLMGAQAVAHADQAVTYSGPFTNTTVDAGGTFDIYLDIGSDNAVSGYADFTGPPRGTLSSLCGAGPLSGTKQGDSIEFVFTSHDLDPGCGHDWGAVFTVIGTLTQDGQAFDGDYTLDRGQQGIFGVTAIRTIAATPDPLTTQLTYPAIQPNRELADTLIVVIHGCCKPANSDFELWRRLADSLGGPGRVVWLYNWRKDAGQDDTLPSALEAKTNAVAHGKYLGTSISASSYDYVHFIGHSAGSQLIDQAIGTIKTNRDELGLNDPVIHATFLDAFTLPFDQFFYGDDLEDRDYAEHYVDFGLPTTAESLLKAYNFDITRLNPDPDLVDIISPSAHGWPIKWYQQSIADPGANSFGFPLSFEYGGVGDDPASFYTSLREELRTDRSLSPGGVCVLTTSNTECIPNLRGDLRPIIVYRPLVESSFAGGIDAILTSITGRVDLLLGALGGLIATLTDGSPVWFEVPITTSEPFNLIKFDYAFLSDAGSEGILTVFVDDRPVYKVDERTVELEVNTAADIPVGELTPGAHTIGFRLDPFTDVQSVARISGIELGAVVDTPIPDTANLQPTGITFDTATAVVNGTVFFDSGVLNTGDDDTDVFNIKWFVNDEEVGAFGSHGGVPAGQTVLDGNSQFSWAFDRPGLHSVTFALDVDNHVAEANEGDNITTISVVVVQP